MFVRQKMFLWKVSIPKTRHCFLYLLKQTQLKQWQVLNCTFSGINSRTCASPALSDQCSACFICVICLHICLNSAFRTRNHYQTLLKDEKMPSVICYLSLFPTHYKIYFTNKPCNQICWIKNGFLFLLQIHVAVDSVMHHQFNIYNFLFCVGLCRNILHLLSTQH